MKVIFVGAGPGDPELLTVKAAALLADAKVCIYAGSLVGPDVLAVINEDCEKHDSAKLSLEEIGAICKDAQARDLDVIRLHTGDPSIYGAIAEQMRMLDAMGIAYEAVPGVSSFQAAAAALPAELTAPEIAQAVILARVAGRTPVPETQELERLAATRATLCLFLSVHDLTTTAERLVPFYGEDCPAAVVYHASWRDEKIVRGTLSTIAKDAEGIARTAMILVGPALGRGGTDSRLYASDFTHGYRSADA